MEHASFASPDIRSMDRLSKWDGDDKCMAPLTARQKDSFLELAAIASNRPMPIEVCFGLCVKFLLLLLKIIY